MIGNYVHVSKFRFLSSQHCAKSQSVNNMVRKGIGETTTAHTTKRFWNHGINKISIHLGYHDNIATLNIDPGYQEFMVFESVLKLHKTQGALITESKVLNDNEDDQYNNVPSPAKPRQTLWSQLTGLQIIHTQA